MQKNLTNNTATSTLSCEKARLKVTHTHTKEREREMRGRKESDESDEYCIGGLMHRDIQLLMAKDAKKGLPRLCCCESKNS